MKSKKVKRNIDLKPGDIEAIICALPLVANTDADTPEQSRLNAICCETAANKLLSKSTAFSANELRVISVAIDFALDVLKGTGNEFISIHDVDSEWKADLSKNLFSYMRMKPAFDELLSNFIRDRN